MDNINLYREEILEHSRHPQNFGKIKNPTRQAYKANPLCGDAICLQFMLNEQSMITKVRFKGAGCALSVAAASVFTEWMHNKSLDRLKNAKPKIITKLLKVKVSPARLKCALLPYEALRECIENKPIYFSKRAWLNM